MGEHHEPGTATAVGVTGAFTAARELLHGAEQDAERTRAGADRYARQREHEAELLVGKARRLLAAAEEKAALIIATARAQAPHAMATVAEVLDLGALDEDPMPEPGRPVPTELDRMLASAIAHAVDSAQPPETMPTDALR